MTTENVVLEHDSKSTKLMDSVMPDLQGSAAGLIYVITTRAMEYAQENMALLLDLAGTAGQVLTSGRSPGSPAPLAERHSEAFARRKPGAWHEHRTHAHPVAEHGPANRHPSHQGVRTAV